MSDSHSGSGQAGQGKLLTLSEVSKRLKLSMPTLQRYKKLHQARIPSVGNGRKQRYPESSLSIFEELRQEHAARRGRPRKNPLLRARQRAAEKTTRRGPGRPRKDGRRAAPAAPIAPVVKRGPGRPRREVKPVAKSNRRLLTLTQIRKLTGISYPTLVRYVRLYADQLPHEGLGRKRRFYPESEAVFRRLREEGGRGGRRKGSQASNRVKSTSSGIEGMLRQQVKALEKSQEVLERKFRDFARSLHKLFS
jgi:predicted DNA-binding transcriptional regulator AlpA